MIFNDISTEKKRKFELFILRLEQLEKMKNVLSALFLTEIAKVSLKTWLG